MKVLVSIAFLFIVIVIGNVVIVAQTDMKAPVAKKVPRVLKIHGYEITDNYFWLRDRNDKKAPEVIKYLEDNNKYTESFMGQHAGFADNLYKEMLGRIKQTDTSVPYRLGEYWYFVRPRRENNIRHFYGARPKMVVMRSCCSIKTRWQRALSILL